MSQRPRSRFTIRRRLLEVALVLWVIAYFYGLFEKADQTAQAPRAPSPVTTPSH